MNPYSVFFEFSLPNATTWFYFSFLLAVALFFKCSRVLSVRNWDVVTVFLLVPGMLLIEDAQPTASQQRLATATLVGNATGSVFGAPVTGLSGVSALAPAAQIMPKSSL